MSFLLNFRTKKKFTQQQMADLLCVSRPTYKLWEDCPGKIPLDYLKKLIKCLDLNKDELLEILGYVDKSCFLNDIAEIKRNLISIQGLLQDERI